jgi:RNA polymerase sigma factor (sigma-70 family)
MDAVVSDTMTEQQNAEIERTVRKERGRLFNFIRKRVRHDDDAQDILQDVFGQLIDAYRKLETIERVTSWMFQVARNKIADTYRNKTPEAMLQTKTEREDGWNLQDILADLSESPEELYIRDVIWNEIETAVEELPQPQRDVFIWREFEGMSFNEMSELTGDTENALRLRRHYAMRSLRARLQSLYDEI